MRRPATLRRGPRVDPREARPVARRQAEPSGWRASIRAAWGPCAVALSCVAGWPCGAGWPSVAGWSSVAGWPCVAGWPAAGWLRGRAWRLQSSAGAPSWCASPADRRLPTRHRRRAPKPSPGRSSRAPAGGHASSAGMRGLPTPIRCIDPLPPLGDRQLRRWPFERWAWPASLVGHGPGQQRRVPCHRRLSAQAAGLGAWSAWNTP